MSKTAALTCQLICMNSDADFTGSNATWSVSLSALALSRQYRQLGKGICGVRIKKRVLPGRGRVTLSADMVNFWSCVWSCGWPGGAAASLGSVPGFPLQSKHRHVTPLMTYIKTSGYVSRRERDRGRSQAEMSPFCLQLMSGDDIIGTRGAVSHGRRGVVGWWLLRALAAQRSPAILTFNRTLSTKGAQV